MAITVSGVEELMLKLSQTGERAIRGVSDEIKDGAKDIQDLARLQAPVDEGNLEDAIKVEFERTGINRRVEAFVYVDGDQEADDGKVVGDYAPRMHEGTYNLGPRSKIKQSAAGVIVGRKFLERAVDDLAPKIINRVYRAVKGVIK
jgi:hypothetical protein